MQVENGLLSDMSVPERPLRILRPLRDIGETSAPYNQFSLPFRNSSSQSVSICTFFKPTIDANDGIRLFVGDGTFGGFYRLLRSVWDPKKYDIVHVHSPHIAMMLLAGQPFLNDILQSAVYTVHNSFPSYSLRNKLLMLLPFRAFPRIVFCSHASYESFPRVYKRLVGNRARVVQNGMDVARVDRVLRNRDRQRPSGTFNVAVVGRLIDIKNPLTALHAFHESCPNASRLTFIGEGPFKEIVAQSADQIDLDGHVQFTGLVPREKVYELMSDADLYLSTSKGEGLPVSTLEAMACRCPVILSDIPPHREIAEGASFIPLISSDDTSGFAREINRFHQMPRSECARIGEQCRALVEKCFNLETMHRRYEEIYKELLERD